MTRGKVVLTRGTPLGAGEIGVLAAVQKASVLVARRPLIGILSTGDEVVGIGEERKSGNVVNSNAYALAAMVRDAGAIPRLGGIIPDNREATVRSIEASLDCDFVLSTGGVSAGAFDYVKDALDTLGAETKFWRVAMKPGKPVVFSLLRGVSYFGLPGNPVSCLVSFILFVAPGIRKAMNMKPPYLSPTVRTRLLAPLRSTGERRTYQRVRVSAAGGELVSQPMRAQGSGVSTSMAGANGLAVIESGVTTVPEGTLIDTVLFGPVNAG